MLFLHELAAVADTDNVTIVGTATFDVSVKVAKLGLLTSTLAGAVQL